MLGIVAMLLVSLASGVVELRVQLAQPSQALTAGGVARSLRVLSQRTIPGTMRRERRPELSPGRLMIVVSDAAGAELDRRTIADPRIIRIESPDASGQFAGRTLTSGATELRFAIPDFADASRVRIYEPAGDENAPALVGEIELRR